MKTQALALTALSTLAMLLSPTLAASADYGRSETGRPLAGKVDGEWVSLNGKVKDVDVETFTVALNGTEITVEMDDYDWYNENVMLPGDEVTVTGVLDNDFYERRTIEASSVYVQKLGRYYYANSDDEEGGYYSSYLAGTGLIGAKEGDWLSLVGTVIEIGESEFRLDTGPQIVSVETDGLTYDPLKPDSLNRLKIGDRVSIAGEMDDADFFEAREIEASSVVILSGKPA